VTYTQLCFVGIAFSVLLDLVILRTNLLRRKAFWVSYAIIVVFQLLTNGWLTGRRIVTYDADAVIGGSTPRLWGGGRIFYAPVEDLLFGFALVLQTLAWWVFWGRRGVQREPGGQVRPSATARSHAVQPPPEPEPAPPPGPGAGSAR
jgi:lycopene cyclase domain-containing protein